MKRLLLIIFLAAVSVAPSLSAQTFCVPPKPPAQPPPQDPPCPACEPKECNKCTKSPVYVGAGTYVRDETDLSIRTVGPQINVTRHYDSSRVVDGPLGIGWNSSLTPRIFNSVYAVGPSTNSNVASVVMPHGALYNFTRTSSSNPIFTPPLGRRDLLVQNPDGSFTLTIQNSRTALQFRADGGMASISDEFGNVTNYTYDVNGRIQRVADGSGSGRYVDVTWNPSGRIGSVTDSAGRTVRYTYAVNGQLESVADAATPVGQQSINYTYVSGRFSPLLSRVADRWNRVISAITWDSADRVHSYTDGAFGTAGATGEKYTYTYMPEGIAPEFIPLTIKQHSLGSTTYKYIAATGLVVNDNTDYDGSGNIVARYDDDGNKTQYSYDSFGRIYQETIYSGATPAVVWTTTYDPAFPDKITSRKSSLPAKWTGYRYEYYQSGDPAPGALKSAYRIRPDGVTEDKIGTWVYDSHGRVTSVTDVPDSPTISYQYDAAGNLTRVGRSTIYTYYGHDSLGRVTSVTDPTTAVTSYTYDSLDRLLTMTLPKPTTTSALDFTTTYTYDNYDAATGLVFVHITDPNGKITKNGYDALGQLQKTIDALSQATANTYENGLLKSVTDANGNVTAYTYSSSRQLQSTTHPDGAVESYERSTRGRLETVTDRRGNKRKYLYDSYGRMKAAYYPDLSLWPNGTYKGIYYNYDGDRMVSVFDQLVYPPRTYEYTYDASARISSEGYLGDVKLVYAYANATTSLIHSYTITPPAGNTDRVTTVYYGYDSMFRLRTVSYDNTSWEARFTYNLRDQYDTIEFANGLERVYTYDRQGRLTELNNTHPTLGTVAKYTYDYDYNVIDSTWTRLGQRYRVTVDAHDDANQVEGQTTYRYDDNYQLLRVDQPNAKWAQWTYDAIGNRLTAQTQSTSVATYEYYKYAGNPNNSARLKTVTGNPTTYTYDANGNRSNNATWDIGNHLSQYVSTSFAYDWMDRRIAAATYTYTYHGQNVARERDTTYFKLNDYLFGAGIDEPLVKMDRLGEKTYYVTDGLGSVVAAVDQSGNISQGRAYDAWGDSAGAAPSFGYTGREPGPPGLYYRARYYEPKEGRFVSEDPLGRFSNRYIYVGNDPILFIDPFGLERVNKPYAPPPPIPPGQLLCQGRVQSLWLLKQEAESWAVSDKWKHCYIGCEISKVCGNVVNFVAAYGKEVLDAGTNVLNWLSRDPARRGVEFADAQATRVGESCSSDQRGCDCCCRQTFTP